MNTLADLTHPEADPRKFSTSTKPETSECGSLPRDYVPLFGVSLKPETSDVRAWFLDLQDAYTYGYARLLTAQPGDNVYVWNFETGMWFRLVKYGV
jgi:hypothetical protein